MIGLTVIFSLFTSVSVAIAGYALHKLEQLETQKLPSLDSDMMDPICDRLRKYIIARIIIAAAAAIVFYITYEFSMANWLAISIRIFFLQ